MAPKRTYNYYIPAREVYYTQAQAAREYGVSLMTIWRYANEYNLINKYLLPGGRDGRGCRTRYRKSELDAVFIPVTPVGAAELSGWPSVKKFAYR